MTDKSAKSSKPSKEMDSEKKLAAGPDPAKKQAKKTTKPKLAKKEQKTALEEAKAQAEKYKSQLAYLQAEYENYAKSMERREANLRLQANRDVILSLLPILDDLERAQLMVPQIEVNEPFINGFTMLVENLKSALEHAGVKLIECEGQVFDPLRHEAVVREESDSIAPNTVIEELRKGYLLKGALLRPSMVKITVAPASSSKAEVNKDKTKTSAKNVSSTD
jgi:molecular chaperone GrpE